MPVKVPLYDLKKQIERTTPWIKLDISEHRQPEHAAPWNVSANIKLSIEASHPQLPNMARQQVSITAPATGAVCSRNVTSVGSRTLFGRQ
jgi:hypothetical protein